MQSASAGQPIASRRSRATPAEEIGIALEEFRLEARHPGLGGKPELPVLEEALPVERVDGNGVDEQQRSHQGEEPAIEARREPAARAGGAAGAELAPEVRCVDRRAGEDIGPDDSLLGADRAAGAEAKGDVVEEDAALQHAHEEVQREDEPEAVGDVQVAHMGVEDQDEGAGQRGAPRSAPPPARRGSEARGGRRRRRCPAPSAPRAPARSASAPRAGV